MERLAGCCENMSMPPCVWFEGGDKRNAYASMLAGFLFFTGWWFLIDAAAVYDTVSNTYFICGIIGTLSLFMVNSVSNAQIRGEAYDGGCLGPRGARVWLFFGFVMGFASVIAACWILFADFVATGSPHAWPGVALFMQNSFIFLGSLIYKFGRSEDLWG